MMMTTRDGVCQSALLCIAIGGRNFKEFRSVFLANSLKSKTIKIASLSLPNAQPSG